jgi:hypothetical protein
MYDMVWGYKRGRAWRVVLPAHELARKRLEEVIDIDAITNPFCDSPF